MGMAILPHQETKPKIEYGEEQDPQIESLEGQGAPQEFGERNSEVPQGQTTPDHIREQLAKDGEPVASAEFVTEVQQPQAAGLAVDSTLQPDAARKLLEDLVNNPLQEGGEHDLLQGLIDKADSHTSVN
jgi:hypothetical protein